MPGLLCARHTPNVARSVFVDTQQCSSLDDGRARLQWPATSSREHDRLGGRAPPIIAARTNGGTSCRPPPASAWLRRRKQRWAVVRAGKAAPAKTITPKRKLSTLGMRRLVANLAKARSEGCEDEGGDGPSPTQGPPP
jgi:hypothetical protein